MVLFIKVFNRHAFIVSSIDKMFEDEERKKLLTYKESLEEFLAVVDALRSGEIYSHLSCERKFYILRV